MGIEGTIKKLDAHIWEREANEHYVEPEWCSHRLFEEEGFHGPIWDPACGFGNIVKSARACGLYAFASDLVCRAPICEVVKDFFHEGVTTTFFEDGIVPSFPPAYDIVTNPPFNIADKFALHAIDLAIGKVAIVFPTARLNAAHWLRGTPLKTIWLMTPRPSMPPGHVIARGEKPGGGKMDYCWLVWEHGHSGEAEIKWLRRDKMQEVTHANRSS